MCVCVCLRVCASVWVLRLLTSGEENPFVFWQSFEKSRKTEIRLNVQIRHLPPCGVFACNSSSAFFFAIVCVCVCVFVCVCVCVCVCLCVRFSVPSVTPPLTAQYPHWCQRRRRPPTTVSCIVRPCHLLSPIDSVQVDRHTYTQRVGDTERAVQLT